MKGTKSLSHFDLSFEFLQSDLQRLTFPESTIMFRILFRKKKKDAPVEEVPDPGCFWWTDVIHRCFGGFFWFVF